MIIIQDYLQALGMWYQKYNLVFWIAGFFVLYIICAWAWRCCDAENED